MRACRGAAHRAYNTILAQQALYQPYFVTVRDSKGRLREVPVIRPRPYGPSVWSTYGSTWGLDRLSLRQDLFEHCLEEKGYRMVPDDSAN